MTEEMLDVVILGAGFSGLAAAYYLQREGITNYKIVEKASELGGTWFYNRYPGCGCDIQSHLYSFSFAPNPNWSKTFSKWDEILEYLNDTADKHGIRDNILFSEQVIEANYDADKKLWSILLNSGKQLVARNFFASTGPLHVPNVPQIPGLESFTGQIMHSSKWDTNAVFEGKTVVSIGTGASAIQYIPKLAKLTKKLYVFQRTPAWVMPKDDHRYTAKEKERFTRYPWLAKLLRLKLFLRNELILLPFYFPFLGRMFEAKIRERIARHVSDPQNQKTLTPDYRFGCKRVLMSRNYYLSFNRENVELTSDTIERVTPDGVVTTNGTEIKADIIVFGTGFKTDPRETMQHSPFRGRSGVALHETWSQDRGPKAYLGITVPDFPNFFILLGPNTGLGHNSVIVMIERQARYAAKCISLMKKRGVSEMEIKPEAWTRYCDWIDRKQIGSPWLSGCASWYLDKNGVNFSIWPASVVRYIYETRSPKLSDYDLS